MVTDPSKIIICWRCGNAAELGDPYGVAKLLSDDIIGVVGVCSNCLEPGICDFVCEHEHVHTKQFIPDLRTVDGLRAFQFILDSAASMLSKSGLDHSSRELVRQEITRRQSELNRLMQPYQS